MTTEQLDAVLHYIEDTKELVKDFFGDVAKLIVSAAVKSAEREYREKFGKLPGSMRTKRLRKKRNVAMFRVYLLDEE